MIANPLCQTKVLSENMLEYRTGVQEGKLLAAEREMEEKEMDMGDLTSHQIGELMSGGILRAEEQMMRGRNQLADMGQTATQNELAEMGHAVFAGLNQADKGTIPATIKNQNLGHNSKKVGLGPNTKQK